MIELTFEPLMDKIHLDGCVTQLCQPSIAITNDKLALSSYRGLAERSAEHMLSAFVL